MFYKKRLFFRYIVVTIRTILINLALSMISWSEHRQASDDAVLDGSTGNACVLISRETGAELRA